HRGVGLADDVELGLADPDRLDDDPGEAAGVHQLDHVTGGPGEPAEAAPRGHAPDEHVGVERVRLHADAVAQDRAAGEGARGIHRDHPDRQPPRAEPAPPPAASRSARSRLVTRSTSVDLPAPGGPVMPSTYARPVRPWIARMMSGTS